ncbi:globin domain-containing protein [Streptomyces sp. NBC_01142]|uniref:globin domain-containing protein n=1 Tax=Streptomyces sp. NBC_01142 TaxID=2975865 RepID=UPI0022516E7D|nr:globin domain-containing protein [Streptomyces sp. NBC_01142]MCX4824323.1 globin domain-containing protein [Streptomyces sp. NBC_01142]
MDAPTTTSADNGTSGESGGGGWFTPRKQPAQGRSAPEPSTAESAAGGGGGAGDGGAGERVAGPRRPVASIRPVGSGTARPAPPPSRAAGHATAPRETEAPLDEGPVDDLPNESAPDEWAPPGAAHAPPGGSEAAVNLEAPGSRGHAGPREARAVQEDSGRYEGTAPRGPQGLRVVSGPDERSEPPKAPGLHLVPDPHDAAGVGEGQSGQEAPRVREVPGPCQGAGPAAGPAPHEASARHQSAGPYEASAAGAAVGPHAVRNVAHGRDAYAGHQPQAPRDAYAGHQPQAPRDAQGGHQAPAPHDLSRPATAPASFAAPTAAPTVPASPAAPVDDASPDAILIRRTMAEVASVADKVTSYFYALLFVRHPELRGLFPAAMDSQRDRLLKALLTAAEHMDNAAVLTDYLQHLGRGHRKYGTQPSHYPAVGEALIGSLSRYATTTWDEETEAAWIRTYTTISQIMIDAAAQNERHAPAWWQAEVVSHDLRTPDIAIITVRPDQPYTFLAGQYTSLETPWWPRIWRHYSFAGAPRSDGLLSFHVKAVPAGWVSNALVHHARPGDVMRLGPPAGSMTVDHTTDNGLLCLGGGTGIAPIKALVEDVAEHGARRPVEVFYGARTDFDLYDIDTMLRLQQSHPWLHVRAVVDDRAQFPDAVREYGPWYEYDAYLSGPPGMIRSGVDALRGIGIPFDRIRHDSLEELVAAGD